MKISSTVFTEGREIPRKYTCDSNDISPPLEFSDVPAGAQSLALICDDPDAPGMTWVHWVYYDIPLTSKGLPERVAPDDTPSPGGTQGITDFRRIGYGGPCPPGGTHRYFFKLYALDSELGLPAGKNKEELLEAMRGHIIAEARLMGTYSR